MRKPMWMLVLCIAFSGCVSDSGAPSSPDESLDGSEPAAPQRPAAPDETADQPATQEADSDPELGARLLTTTLTGYILVRPLSTGDTVYEGDRPWFTVDVPENATSMRAALTWDTPQDMALELLPPNEGQRIQSWDQTPTVVRPLPPIEMHLDGDELVAGTWGFILGPPIIGGHVNWALDLELAIQGGGPDEFPLNAS